MIEARNIVKSFEDKEVLKDVSATFRTGYTNLIIGQSGSGKTVFLKTLVGLHEADSGSVVYDDRNFTGMSKLERDRKSTRLNSSHVRISYAVFCLKKKKSKMMTTPDQLAPPHPT